jgi:hypothetical protein
MLLISIDSLRSKDGNSARVDSPGLWDPSQGRTRLIRLEQDVRTSYGDRFWLTEDTNMLKRRIRFFTFLASIVGVLSVAPILPAVSPAFAQMPPALSATKTTNPPASLPAPAISTPGRPAQPEHSLASQIDQGLQRPSDVITVPVSGQSVPPVAPSWWSNQNAMTISVVVLGFGAITILIAAYMIRAERDSQVILRILATLSIITFAVFLIVAGYSDQQIAPAMGLLGTIAGYLLGKDPTRPREQNPDKPAL